MRHVLKTASFYFNSIVDGSKTFEVRKNDRNFKVGDKLLLQKFDIMDGGTTFHGPEWEGEITYILDDPKYCKEGFVIMGIKEKSYDSN